MQCPAVLLFEEVDLVCKCPLDVDDCCTRPIPSHFASVASTTDDGGGIPATADVAQVLPSTAMTLTRSPRQDCDCRYGAKVFGMYLGFGGR